jgi:hypothetical protein
MKKRVLIGMAAVVLSLSSCKTKTSKNNDNNNDDEDISDVSEDTPKEDEETIINSTVSLNSNLEDKVKLKGDGKYNNKDFVTVEANAYLGYKFKGWFINDSVVSYDEKYTFVMPKEDVSLKAVYELDDNLNNLIYTSDYNTCVISGVKDKSVKKLVIPNYVTKVTEGALNGCGNLETLTIPFVGDENKTPTGGIKYPLGYMFGKNSYEGGVSISQHYYETYAGVDDSGDEYYNSSLKPMYDSYIPQSLKEIILDGAISLQSYSFDKMNLDKIVISKSLKYIDSMPFREATIGEIYYEGNIGDLCGVDSYYGQIFSNIEKNDFYLKEDGLYTNIKNEIIIPDGVTEINNGVFENCQEIDKIVIPKSIKSIGESAFEDVTGTSAIYYNGTLDDWCSIEIEDGGNPISTTYTVGETYNKTLYVLDETGDVTYNGQKYKAVCGNISLNKISKNSFYGYAYINEVHLENGITTIPDYAFNNSSITVLYIPSSVTVIEEDGLYGCDNLVKIYNYSGVDISSDEAKKYYYIYDQEIEIITE